MSSEATSKDEKSRVLVIAPAWIGDMVMLQTLFHVLRQRQPNARLDALAPPGIACLLDRMPQVDDVVTLSLQHGELGLGARRKAAEKLRANGYDQAIVMQRSLKSALVPWLAGIPQRTGYRGEMRFGLINDMRRVDTTRYRLKVEHYVNLGMAHDDEPLPAITAPALTIDHANRSRLAAFHDLDPERPVVGFAPGAAYGSAKQWPPSHFAALAGELDRRGVATWVFGGPGDAQLGADIVATAPQHGVNLCGQTSLLDAVDLSSLAQTFVGNDSGIMHLASATVRRVIGLYGPTHPAYAPPLAQDSLCLWTQPVCAPCRQRECPLGHKACLRDLPVDDVLRACLDSGSDAIASRYPRE